jgi:hypothetical protein
LRPSEHISQYWPLGLDQPLSGSTSQIIGSGFGIADTITAEVVAAQKTAASSVSVKQYLRRARSWCVMDMQIIERRILEDMWCVFKAERTLGPRSSMSRLPCQQVGGGV